MPTGTPAAAGTWHAILEVDKTDFKKQLGRIKEQYSAELVRSVLAHGLPYSVNVHSYSNLRLRASVAQDGLEPGARLTLRGVLTEYGLPVEGRARVHADVVRPDGTTATLALTERAPGIFEGGVATTTSGVYRFTVKASGVTMRRRPFTREQIVTGHVWRGGNQPPPHGDGDPGGLGEQLCRFVRCLLKNGLVSPEQWKRLEALGIDLDAILRCCAGSKRIRREQTRSNEPAPTHVAERVIEDVVLRSPRGSGGRASPGSGCRRSVGRPRGRSDRPARPATPPWSPTPAPTSRHRQPG